MKNKRWTPEEVERLKQIMAEHTVTKVGCMLAAKEFDRSTSGVLAKWKKVKPNRKPYMDQQELSRILYSNVSKHPGNLSKAFRITAEQTGKTVGHIHNRYYAKSSPMNKDISPVCFTMISRDRMCKNKKNFDTAEQTTKSRLKEWLNKLFGMKSK